MDNDINETEEVSGGKNAKISKIAFPLIIIGAFLMLLFPGIYMQYKFGVFGLIASEVMLLAVSLLSVYLMKGSFKAAFPMKKMTFRELFGCGLIYLGGYILITAASVAMVHYFPEQFNEVGDSLSDALKMDSFLITLFISAVMPAICEEALFRGALLYSAGWMKRKVLMCFIIGIIFGAFHMDMIRFIPTAILGVIFTYIAYKTGNILYPILLHFLNNSLSVISLYSVGEVSQATQAVSFNIPLSAVASYLIISAAAPFIILAGINKLEPKQLKKYYNLKYYIPGNKQLPSEKKRKLIATVLAFALFIPGVVVLSGDIMKRQPVLDISSKESVNCDTPPTIIEFSLPEDNIYTFSYEIANERGIIEMLLLDDKGEVVEKETFRDLTAQWQYLLTKGDYQIKIIYHISDLWEFCEANELPYTEQGDLILLNMDGDLKAYMPVEIKINVK